MNVNITDNVTCTKARFLTWIKLWWKISSLKFQPGGSCTSAYAWNFCVPTPVRLFAPKFWEVVGTYEWYNSVVWIPWVGGDTQTLRYAKGFVWTFCNHRCEVVGCKNFGCKCLCLGMSGRTTVCTRAQALTPKSHHSGTFTPFKVFLFVQLHIHGY